MVIDETIQQVIISFFVQKTTKIERGFKDKCSFCVWYSEKSWKRVEIKKKHMNQLEGRLLPCFTKFTKLL